MVSNPRQNYFVAYNYNNTPTSLSDDKKYVFDKTNGLPESGANIKCFFR
jgi:hypothetical protein